MYICKGVICIFSDNGGLSGGAIAGIVIGVIAGVAAVIGIGVFIRKKNA